MSTKYSILIPCYNEEKSIITLLSKLKKVFTKKKVSFEIIVVDDGSSDNTFNLLQKEIKKSRKNLEVYRFNKNYGKSAVYDFGFKKAKGEIIVTIDADLQDAPEEIPSLVEKINKGFDLVVGWRKERSDKKVKKIESLLWNKTISFFTGLKIHDANSGLKAIRKKALRSVNLHGDFHRYLPMILFLEGYKIAEVPVVHKKRIWGKSKYSFFRIFYAFFDFFTFIFLSKFGKKPMHFFGSIGFTIFFIGAVINLYLLVIKLQGNAIGGRPLLILGVLMTISGLQFIMTGFLGDLVIRSSTSKSSYSFEKYS